MVKFTVVKPRKVNDKAMRKELSKAIVQMAKSMEKSYNDVTKGWRGAQPNWKYSITANQYIARIALETTNDEGAKKWTWLDAGTDPHIILPRNVSKLRYPGVYVAGSSPNSMTTRNARSSPPFVFSKGVIHPGIAARGWSGILEKYWSKELPKLLEPVYGRIETVSDHKYPPGG